MQALCLGETLALRDDLPEPERGPGQALIRVVLAGICGTDLALLAGYHAFRGILGHEFVGVVEDSDDRRWIGRRVVGEINVGCGTCERCRAGRREHCPERRVLGLLGWDGCFAERLVLPEENLHAVPANVPDEAAVFCEPLAAAVRVVHQIDSVPGHTAALIGPGRLGLLVAQMLRRVGCQVTVLGRRPESLTLAADLGFATGLTADAEPNAYHVTVEATGTPEGSAEAIRLTRPEGTVVLKSTFPGEAPIDLSAVVVKELKVIGSRCGPFEPALGMLARGEVEVARLVDATYPLRDGLQAMEHAGREGARKVLFRPTALTAVAQLTSW